MPQIIRNPLIIIQIDNLNESFDSDSNTATFTSSFIKSKTELELECMGHKKTSDFDISISYISKNNNLTWEEDLLKTEIIPYSRNSNDKLVGKIFEVQFNNNLRNPSEETNISVKIHNDDYLNGKISKIMLSINLMPSNLRQLKTKFEETAGSVLSTDVLPKISEINSLKEKTNQLSKELKLIVSTTDQKKYLISNIPNYISVSDLTMTFRDFQNDQNIKSGIVVSKFDSLSNTLAITSGCGILSGKINFNKLNNTYSFNFELNNKCNGLIESKVIGHNFIVELIPAKVNKNYVFDFEMKNNTLLHEFNHNLNLDFINSDYKFKCEGVYYQKSKSVKVPVEHLCAFNYNNEFQVNNRINIKTDSENYKMDLGTLELLLVEGNGNSLNFKVAEFEDQFIKFVKVTMSIQTNEVTFDFKIYDLSSYEMYKLENAKGIE